ncbi:MAG: hypothetical protein HC837_08775 [Chloroflexaceae bacterium]|nr:hypothetical protein [Chloroflexaceae bacterium]
MWRLLLLIAVAITGILGLAWLPLQAQNDKRCFSETNQCINGRIREFWEQSGGLSVFGYPIQPQQAEVVEGQLITLQWFERNRLELHPENERPYDVLLGRLGVDKLELEGRNWRDFETLAPGSVMGGTCRMFVETGHSVCGDFLDAWRANGLEFDGQPGFSDAENLALFGMAVSSPQTEVVEGREYLVQWFERARFELHPEYEPPYRVLFGLLGNDLASVVRPQPRPSESTAPPETNPPPRDTNSCPTEVLDSLQSAYEQVAFRDFMGCADTVMRGEQLDGALQWFERGVMIWLPPLMDDDPGRLYVVYRTDGKGLTILHQGYQVFADMWNADTDLPDAEPPSDELLAPTGRFGKVWHDHADVRERLGWAIAASQPDIIDAQLFFVSNSADVTNEQRTEPAASSGALLWTRTIEPTNSNATRAVYAFGPEPANVLLVQE